MGEMIIEVEIVEARDLLASDRNGLSDPYVVVDKSCGIMTSAKTPVIKKTLNPVWNYTTVLHFDPSFYKIKFKVFDWDRFSSDDPLGSCSFSAGSLADGVPLDVWEPLKQKPKKKCLSSSFQSCHCCLFVLHSSHMFALFIDSQGSEGPVSNKG